MKKLNTKRLSMLLIAFVLLLASSTQNAYAISPEGTVTDSVSWNTGLTYGAGTITANYDDKIFEDSTYLPITFSLNVSNVSYVSAVQVQQWNGLSYDTVWINMTSFNNGGVLNSGQTTETLFLEVDDSTQGNETVYITGYKFTFWSSQFDMYINRIEDSISLAMTFEVVSSDTTPPVVSGGGIFFTDYDNPDDLNTIKAELSAVDETDGNISNDFVIIYDEYTGNEGVLGDHLTRWEVEDSAGNSAIVEVTVRVIDLTDPVVTLSGSSTVHVEYGSSYTELGASWTDNHDGSGSATISGSVNTNVLGTYTLTYTYTDISGNTDSVTRTVFVEDNTAPEVTLNGSTTIYVEFGDSYSELGASWTDEYDGSGAATITGTVNENVLGTYTLTYSYTDTSGNSDSVTRTVIVRDTTAPVLTLIGIAHQYIEYNSTYTDFGATWTDAYDGTGTASVSGSVNTAILGDYTLTYTYTDSSGNSTSITRTVTVRDTTAPVITISGDSTIYVEFGDSYTELGATWIDAYDGSGAITTITSNVNVNELGTYTVTYTKTDSNGNSALPKTRTVIVRDTTDPVLTLNGDSTVYIEYKGPYTELGASWTDIYDGSGSATVSGSVDNQTLGTYTITYTYTDSSGNSASITRSVIVRDTVAPTVNFTGDFEVTLEVNSVFVDPGASWTDSYEGSGTAYVSGTVDTSTIGNYVLTYYYTDSSGNYGSIERRFLVRDTQDPIVTLNGNPTIYVEVYETYTEPGAIWTDAYEGTGTALVQGSYDLNTLGTYTLTYYYIDSSGNTGSITRNIVVRDTTAPVITIAGNTTVYVEFPLTYTEPGATWTDNYDAGGSVTAVTSTVNNDVLGTYTVTYTVTDSSGNTASEVVRTVIVRDTTLPQLTLQGDSIVYVEFGDNYTEEGTTWTDNYDGSGDAVKTGSINVGVLGSYTLTYTYTDSSGNEGVSVTRTVIVRDTTAPSVRGELTNVITFNSQSQSLGDLISKLQIFDLYDGDLSAAYTIVTDEYTDNMVTPGSYTVSITVTDSNGNTLEHSFTIEVRDDTAPVITTSEQIVDEETANAMTKEEIIALILSRTSS